MKRILRTTDLRFLLLFFALIVQFEACARRAGPIPQGDAIPDSESVGPTAAAVTSQQALVFLSGSVVDREAIPIAGVQIAAAELVSGLTKATAVTDPSGKFRLSLAPGRYKITAIQQGFSQKTYEVTLQPSLSAELSIAMGDLIPSGEREPASLIPPGEPKPYIIEQAFGDEAGLRAWLIELTSQQKSVFTIIPLHGQTSLFYIRPGEAASYSVIPVDGVPDSVGIQAHIDSYQDMKLIGIHCIPGKYLIVLSDWY